VPLRALVGFERVSVSKGGSVDVDFILYDRDFSLVNQDGVRTLYPGTHYVIFARGDGKSDVVFKIAF
jgi:hypothetical protein